MESIFSMFLGGVDYIGLIAILAVGLFYFLAPVAGWSTEKLGKPPFEGAMHLLLIMMAIGVIQVAVLLIFGIKDDGWLKFFILAKSVVFLIAMWRFKNDLFDLTRATRAD